MCEANCENDQEAHCDCGLFSTKCWCEDEDIIGNYATATISSTDKSFVENDLSPGVNDHIDPPSLGSDLSEDIDTYIQALEQNDMTTYHSIAAELDSSFNALSQSNKDVVDSILVNNGYDAVF